MVNSNESESSRSHDQGLRSGVSVVVGILVLVHLSLGLFLSHSLSIDTDEAFTLNSTSSGPLHAYSQAQRFELQPPLYFVSLSIWRRFDDSLFAARLFSLFCTSVSLIVLAGVSHRFLPKIHPGWMVASAAINPTLVYAATEARCYAMAICFSSLLLILFYDAFIQEKSRRRTLVGFALVATCALHTFYFLGFQLVGLASCLLVLRRWKDLRIYVATMVVVGCVFLPQALQVSGQVTDHTAAVRKSTLVESIRLVSWQARDMVFPSDYEPFPDSSRLIWAVVFLAWLIPAVARKKMLKEPRHRAAYSLCAVSLVFYFLAMQVTGSVMLGARHFSPLLCSFLLVSFCLASEAGGRRAVGLWTLLIAVAMGSAVWQRTHRLAKSGDWRRAAEYVMQHESDGEPIVLFRPPAALSFGYYYEGPNTLIPIPAPVEFDEFNVSEYVLRDEDEIARPIEQSCPFHDAIWVIRDGTRNYSSLSLGTRHLDRFLNTYYRIDRGKQLFGSTVTRYSRIQVEQSVASQ